MRIANCQISFKPRIWPTLAATVMVGLTLHLADWQRERAAEKRGLQTEFEHRIAAAPATLGASTQDADALRYRRAFARGEWFARGQIYLENKTDGGTAGYHIIPPLKLAGTDKFVLVNRGWAARSRAYPEPPLVRVPAGIVEVVGTVTVPTAKFLELSAAGVQGNIWQNLTIARYRQHLGLDILPFVLLVSGVKPDSESSLLMLTERPDAGVDKHIEYMLTWYSLATTILVLWIVLNLKIKPLDNLSNRNAGNAP